MKKLKLTIQGMHCASCSSNIERSLKKIKGVKEVSVSVITHKGFVEADDSVDEEEVKKAVSRAGSYKVVSLEKE
ncbi:MAG: heavy-metal-associated domain-containing protein [Nanoarchaeota archaeon]|nr:heavy-metal-associated domain-containing protein [Nanoarchaeota archaeon]